MVVPGVRRWGDRTPVEVMDDDTGFIRRMFANPNDMRRELLRESVLTRGISGRAHTFYWWVWRIGVGINVGLLLIWGLGSWRIF